MPSRTRRTSFKVHCRRPRNVRSVILTTSYTKPNPGKIFLQLSIQVILDLLGVVTTTYCIWNFAFKFLWFNCKLLVKAKRNKCPNFFYFLFVSLCYMTVIQYDMFDGPNFVWLKEVWQSCFIGKCQYCGNSNGRSTNHYEFCIPWWYLLVNSKPFSWYLCSCVVKKKGGGWARLRSRYIHLKERAKHVLYYTWSSSLFDPHVHFDSTPKECLLNYE